MAQVTKLDSISKFVNTLRKLDNASTAPLENPFWSRPISHKRHPMLITSNAWLRQNKYIILYINPQSVQWSLPRRESVTKTAAGAIRNVWRNRFRGTHYDEGTLNITFQSGNLLPGAGIPDELFGVRTVQSKIVQTSALRSNPRNPNEYDQNKLNLNAKYNTMQGYNADAIAAIIQSPPIPPGLENFYDFLELIDQPMVYGAGKENRHILLYRTRVFPMMRIEGYFTGDPITFTETADAGNRLQWTANFQIYRTLPQYWKSTQLKATYVDAMRAYAKFSELFPAGFNLEEFQKWYLGEKKSDIFDPDLPYKKIKATDKSKKPGLATKTADVKTATTPAKTAPKNPEDVTVDRLQTMYKSVIEFKGGVDPYKGKDIWATPMGADMLAELNKWAFAKSPPPTEQEIYQQMAKFFDEHAFPPEFRLAYAPLINNIQNKAYAQGPEGGGPALGPIA